MFPRGLRDALSLSEVHRFLEFYWMEVTFLHQQLEQLREANPCLLKSNTE